MSIEKIIIFSAGGFAVLVAAVIVLWRVPKRLKQDNFAEKWRELQSFCKDKATWPEAIIAADKLLDRALRKRKFKGKSMGERLVSAQRIFTNNDTVWFAHNLYKKLNAEKDAKVKEADVKSALVGFRQALRDLGALPSGEPKDK